MFLHLPSLNPVFRKPYQNVFRFFSFASIVLFVLITVSRGAPELLKQSFSFSLSDLNVHSADEFDRITLETCMSTMQEGAPELPVYPIAILLPEHAVITAISIETKTKEVPGDFFIRPVQKPWNRSDPKPPQHVPPAPLIYASEDLFPAEPAIHSSTANAGGMTVAHFRIHPVRYLPAERKLFFHTDITCTLTCEPAEEPTALSPRHHSRERWNSFTSQLLKQVVNPEDCRRFYPHAVPFSMPYSNTSKGSGEHWTYLVITDPGMQNAFQPLADWKTAKGVPAHVVNTAWIYDQYNGIDPQEKIRECIKDGYQNHGTVWVLLGGDTTYVPVRKAYAMNCEANYHDNENSIPCDLYYADLDGTWNADGDDTFGEITDEVDLLPDVFVGRAPVTTPANTEIFVDKILTYEKNPAPDYLLEMVFMAEILWRNPYTDQGISMDALQEAFVPPRFNVTKLYERDGTETRTSVLNALNEGKHFVNHDGHAWYTIMAVGTGDIGRPDMDLLTNAPRYSIMYSIGCWQAALDFDCVAEHFVLSPGGGGVASIGNSRYGWGAEGDPGFGYSDRFNKQFFKAVFKDDTFSIGAAAALSKVFSIPLARSENVYRWCQYEINLLGDPEMAVHTDTPFALTVSYPGSIPASPSILPVTVSDETGPVTGALVCLRKEGDIFQYARTDATGYVAFEVSAGYPSTDISITCTAHNHLPHEGTVSITAEDAFVGIASYTLENETHRADQQLSPGESADLHFSFTNYGNKSAENVSAEVTVSGTNATVSNSSLAIGTLQEEAAVSPEAAVSLSVDEDTVNGEAVFLQVHITDAESHTWTIPVSFSVATPVLALESLAAEETVNSNQNGIAEPGEELRLTAAITNTGLAEAAATTALFSCESADLVFPSEAQPFGTIASASTAKASFIVTVDQNCEDPSFPLIDTEIRTGSDATYEDSISFSIGTTGFADTVDSDISGHWAAPGADNLWHITTHRSYSGTYSWYCGVASDWTYTRHNTSTLVSNSFYPGLDPVLSFWIWYDVAIYGVNGLYVEINDGTGWEKFDFIGSGGALGPLLMGNNWVRYEYDLSDYPPDTALKLQFRFASDDEPLYEGVYIDDITVTSRNESSLPPPSFIRGDANGDGMINIADAVRVLHYLFQAGTVPACMNASDANDDSVIDISDAVSILLYLFSDYDEGILTGACTTETVDDTLGCLSYPHCR